MQTLYIHKYYQDQCYGGPEEGGWWYDYQSPINFNDSNYMEPLEVVLTQDDDEKAYEICRRYNNSEYARRDSECRYGYTSVLSYREEFFTYDVSESPYPEWPNRPHYE